MQHAATQNDHKELVVNEGAERVISQGQGPLQNEFASTDVGCTNSAIADKRDINGPDSKGPINQDSKFVSPSMFFEACRQGDYETVENLLQNGQDVHVQNSWTYNPDGTINAMHVTARQGHIEAARSLMKYGADRMCDVHRLSAAPSFSSQTWPYFYGAFSDRKRSKFCCTNNTRCTANP